MTRMTKGEHRVGVTFNPSQNPEVALIKSTTAMLIDDLQPIVDRGDEAGRCAAVAQNHYEDACMWAVKAVTKPKREV